MAVAGFVVGASLQRPRLVENIGSLSGPMDLEHEGYVINVVKNAIAITRVTEVLLSIDFDYDCSCSLYDPLSDRYEYSY